MHIHTHTHTQKTHTHTHIYIIKISKIILCDDVSVPQNLHIDDFILFSLKAISI
jgi:hypothetical protein